MKPLLYVSFLMASLIATFLTACKKHSTSADSPSIVGAWREIMYVQSPNQPVVSVPVNFAFLMWLNQDGTYHDTSYSTHITTVGTYQLTKARSLASVGQVPVIEFESKDSLGRTVAAAPLQYSFMGSGGDTLILAPTDYYVGTMYFVRLHGTSIAPQ